ncbi:hypothetical protein BD309DRAFT_958085 [Dichomitus squalens]|uniref:Uncharacterized protein n=1 Tax=Dichomitus squalens TaxID=114155 RepID=A0A4Q9NSF0_9APHY|nr:hypothetical protein BD309DRAFT_958085 [Dichomitus squalens]TBU55253.1 hypothetical protein BD310DRAFT_934124 [Dichomitus squalens]
MCKATLSWLLPGNAPSMADGWENSLRNPSYWVDRDLSSYVHSTYAQIIASQLSSIIDENKLTPQALWYLQDSREQLHAIAEKPSLQEALLGLAESIPPKVRYATLRVRHVQQLSEELASQPSSPTSPPEESVLEQDDNVAESIGSEFISGGHIDTDISPVSATMSEFPLHIDDTTSSIVLADFTPSGGGAQQRTMTPVQEVTEAPTVLTNADAAPCIAAGPPLGAMNPEEGASAGFRGGESEPRPIAHVEPGASSSESTLQTAGDEPSHSGEETGTTEVPTSAGVLSEGEHNSVPANSNDDASLPGDVPQREVEEIVPSEQCMQHSSREENVPYQEAGAVPPARLQHEGPSECSEDSQEAQRPEEPLSPRNSPDPLATGNMDDQHPNSSGGIEDSQDTTAETPTQDGVPSPTNLDHQTDSRPPALTEEIQQLGEGPDTADSEQPLAEPGAAMPVETSCLAPSGPSSQATNHRPTVQSATPAAASTETCTATTTMTAEPTAPPSSTVLSSQTALLSPKAPPSPTITLESGAEMQLISRDSSESREPSPPPASTGIDPGGAIPHPSPSRQAVSRAGPSTQGSHSSARPQASPRNGGRGRQARHRGRRG